MKLYVATLYYKSLGTNYEYFTSLDALEKSLIDSKLFVRGTVSEFKLIKEEYKYNDKVWQISKIENEIKLSQLH